MSLLRQQAGIVVLGPCLAHCLTANITMRKEGKTIGPKEQSRIFDYIDVYVEKMKRDLVALGRWDSLRLYMCLAGERVNGDIVAATAPNAMSIATTYSITASECVTTSTSSECPPWSMSACVCVCVSGTEEMSIVQVSDLRACCLAGRVSSCW